MENSAPVDRDTRPAASTGRVVSNGVLGMVLFLATETMFFAGLMVALIILRAGAGMWPPAGQPRLPVAVTGLNTLVLLLSGWTMYSAYHAIRIDRRRALTRWLALTGALGVSFLLVQGLEWVSLLRYGLRFSSGQYGATFYTLIGAHGLHVVGAVLVLLYVHMKAARGRYSSQSYTDIEVCQLYWLFVVAVWPLLYVLVYLV